MIVKHVQDQEGRKYAIPDHILEDFEVSGSIPLPRSLRGGGSSGRLQAFAAVGGYGDHDPGEEVSNPDPGELVAALNQFLNVALVTATFSELAAALGFAALKTKTPIASVPGGGRFAPSLRRVGGSDGRGSIGGYDDGFDDPIDDVGDTLGFLTNPALSNLKVTVSAAAVRQLLISITS